MFYSLSTLAAAWSEDRNGAFLMAEGADRWIADLANYGSWEHFIPAMQVIADCGEDNDVWGYFPLGRTGTSRGPRCVHGQLGQSLRGSGS